MFSARIKVISSHTIVNLMKLFTDSGFNLQGGATGQRGSKKLLPATAPNANQFSYFFHHHSNKSGAMKSTLTHFSSMF